MVQVEGGIDTTQAEELMVHDTDPGRQELMELAVNHEWGGVMEPAVDFLGEKLKEHAESPVKIYQVGKYKRLNDLLHVAGKVIVKQA